MDVAPVLTRENWRSVVVSEARSWKGTPYHHQAHVKGVGADCWGLIRGVGEGLQIMHVHPDKFKPFAGYARLPNPARMGRGLRVFLDPIERADAGPGDIVWLAWRPDLPMHLGILAEREVGGVMGPTMIHAEGLVGRTEEVGFVDPIPGLVHSCWRFPGVARWPIQ